MENSSDVFLAQMTQLYMLGALIGLLPAIIAHRKGYSFLGWWIFGAALSIVALPLAIIRSPNQSEMDRRALAAGGRKCSYCAEVIKWEAKVCRYCGREITLEGLEGPNRKQ